MKRTVRAELLDTDSGTPAEVRASLGDLRRINCWFGGVATTEAMVERVAREGKTSTLSLLEVAAGTGYVPENVRDRLRRRGLCLQVTLLDRVPSHLSNGERAVVGDALALPFHDGSFDLLSCTLFAHHLSPEELVQFIDEGLRVCRTALLINDLIRNPLHLLLVYAGIPLYRSRITRYDALASVRRSYTPEEMQTFLARTKAARTEIRRHYLFRMGVIAWKY
ncbi:MAG: methyltransferase domain-containing protein [Terriglobales bacterium]